MGSGVIWLPLSLAALIVLFVFGRGGPLPLRLALLALAFVLLLSIPKLAPGQQLDVEMPPDEFIHPFAGQVVVMALSHSKGGPVLSLSHHSAGVCAMWLPRPGDPEITNALYECLVVIEVANCNGAVDVNTPAVKARMPRGAQSSYARRCSQRSWDAAYRTVRP